MQAIVRDVRMVWNALFLRTDAYEEMRRDNNPFVEGVFILAVLGLLLGLAGTAGDALEWAATPDLDQLQAVLLRNLQLTPAWEQATQRYPTFEPLFRQIWNMAWETAANARPSPVSAFTAMVVQPVILVLGWLVYGLLAHFFARLLGGVGTLNQTLGTTALAAAPQLINLFAALPFVAAAGVGVWTLLCRYMAIRTAHELSWSRAVWATVLPYLVVAAVVLAIGGFVATLAAAGLAAFAGGM